MRVLTSFAIVLEFLIGFRNSFGLLMHKECDFRNAEPTSRISSLSEKQISTIFLEILFLRVPRVLLRVLDSSQIVLQISPDTFCSKIKIVALQSFQNFFENLIFESYKSSVESSVFYSNDSTIKSEYTLF